MGKEFGVTAYLAELKNQTTKDNFDGKDFPDRTYWIGLKRRTVTPSEPGLWRWTHSNTLLMDHQLDWFIEPALDRNDNCAYVRMYPQPRGWLAFPCNCVMRALCEYQL